MVAKRAMKDIETRTATQMDAEIALQLVLFPPQDDPALPDAGPRHRRTNAVGLYDIAPRYVFRKPGKEGEVQAPSLSDTPVEREFKFDGKAYNLTLKPAQLRWRPTVHRRKGVLKDSSAKGARKDDKWIYLFPSEREQIVEEVVRRIATSQRRLSLSRDGEVMATFSLYELQRELAEVGHSLNINEIKDALQILRESVIEISMAEGGGGTVLNSSVFPVLAFRSRAGSGVTGNTETYVTFNPLVAASIRAMRYRSISYTWLMRLRSPVSRWLYKRLSVAYEGSDNPQPMSLSALAIQRDSGMHERSRLRDTLTVVRKAVLALEAEGIVTVEIERVEENRAVVDEIYTLTPSANLLREVDAAVRLQEVRQQILEAVVDSQSTGDFVMVDRVAATSARRQVEFLELPAPVIEKP
ncbi:plasmid replication protein [Azospirillum sp.]|uniref:plasmid replication protein n=1 Tax=Azospirillum sp. TaxID=34012 RepID=UPI003D7554A4